MPAPPVLSLTHSPLPVLATPRFKFNDAESPMRCSPTVSLGVAGMIPTARVERAQLYCARSASKGTVLATPSVTDAPLANCGLFRDRFLGAPTVPTSSPSPPSLSSRVASPLPIPSAGLRKSTRRELGESSWYAAAHRAAAGSQRSSPL